MEFEGVSTPRRKKNSSPNLVGVEFRERNYDEGSDDLYLILKKKLFSKLPSEKEIIPIAREFKDAVNNGSIVIYKSCCAASVG